MQIVIKSGYYIEPNPSTALQKGANYGPAAQNAARSTGSGEWNGNLWRGPQRFYSEWNPYIRHHMPRQQVPRACQVWQYGLSIFQGRDTKLD